MVVSLFIPAEGQLMAVDLGHEFFKVALMRQGSPLEIVLNSHSKRKTPTTVSFMESIRSFGDDAMPHAGKAPAKVPMFYHSFLGENFTSEDVQADGRWWQRFGLGSRFYTFNLGFDEKRHVPTFVFGEDSSLSGEVVLANVFHFARNLAEASADGKQVRDVVATVQSGANMRQREAVKAAAEIAGLRVLTIVNEGAAFAVHRAIDFQPDKGKVERVLIFNFGSRKAEATIVQYESKAAGMVAGKTAPVVTILGSAVDFSLGGHFMDLKISERMLKSFQEKHPKLADGIAKNPRALRKLLAQADKTKMVLSANKAASFSAESLYEDTDFQAMIQRADFEEMCQDLFLRLTDPIEAALKAANITMKDITEVEVVGGAWRVPKVQQVLGDYFEEKTGKKMPLGQHLNGEEAGALGAALVGANSSSSFRVKKIFFTDVSAHDYSVQVVALNGSWERNVTKLYPAGSALGSKKKVGLPIEEDFIMRLYEDGKHLASYTVAGVSELMETKWKGFNLTGPVKVSVPVNLESSGMIEVKTPLVTAEQVYWVNVTKEKPGNATANSTGNSSNTSANDKGDAENDSDVSESSESPETESATESGEDGAAADETEENREETPAASNASANATPVEGEAEVVQKQKKKKHEKKLTVKRTDMLPLPMAADDVTDARRRFEDMAKYEAEVTAMNAVKNELEAAIYGTRDKLERDDIIKVSTEEQREEVTKLCSEYEDWMYESSTVKNEYDKRLLTLEELLGPILERSLELESRADMPDTVKEAITDMHEALEKIQTSKPWVDANKTQAAATKLSQFEEWWKKKLEQQDALPLHEAPAYTKVEVQERLQKLQKDLEKLNKIKKPKDYGKVKASKNNSDNAAKPEPAASEADDSPLSSDPETIKKELETVSQQKLDAVEKEDFDTAEAMKKKEQKLKDQLEKLTKTEL